MSFFKSLLVGLVVAAIVMWIVHEAMMSTGNNGEFVDLVTGEKTAHYYQTLAIWGATTVIPLTTLLTAIGFFRRKRD